MFRLLLALAILSAALAASCTETADPVTARSDVDLTGAVPVRIWATHYYLAELPAVPAGSGVPLRDMSERVIGPELSARDWCLAAIEGTVRVAGTVFNFAGTRPPAQAPCPAHPPSALARWAVTQHPFGVGNRGNPLVPFRTIACDQGTVANSRPWVAGQPMRFGQRLFVPSAAGVMLPDGTRHDGIFTCGDTGGAITGNHVDVFIGAVRGGEREAAALDPFDFVTSSASRTVEAFVLPED